MLQSKHLLKIFKLCLIFLTEHGYGVQNEILYEVQYLLYNDFMCLSALSRLNCLIIGIFMCSFDSEIVKFCRANYASLICAHSQVYETLRISRMTRQILFVWAKFYLYLEHLRSFSRQGLTAAFFSMSRFLTIFSLQTQQIDVRLVAITIEYST